MYFYIDGDSFPTVLVPVLQRAARRSSAQIRMVSCKPRKNHESNIEYILVSPLPDEADRWISENASGDDIVFTRDIPFAAILLEKGITVLNDRGTIFRQDSIRERLSQRDFMASLRDSSLLGQSGANFGDKEKHAFSAALDRVLMARQS